MKKAILSLLILTLSTLNSQLSNVEAKSYDNTDTIVVARDGTGEFRNVQDAIEVCRAFMGYHKVIYVKKGTYKEKLIVPAWLTNIEIVGEDLEETIITYDDHANIAMEGTDQKLGTFRSYSVQVNGNDITFRNITIENNAAKLGQAVALHTQGDRLKFINCRILGNQDTIYTGGTNTRLYFKNCYIDGTTDFIFGPSTAWFEECTINSKANSYITAASTPQDVPYGYIFNNCTLTANDDVEKVYLGRPWRDYGYTLFMNCELGKHIRPVGWHPWQDYKKETARYMEYNNRGEGSDTSQRAEWSKQLTDKEAKKITVEEVFSIGNTWIPEE